MAALAMPLDAANEVRLARKRLLDELRHADSRLEAQERCAELLVAGEPALDGLTVFDLVCSCRGLRRPPNIRARKLLATAEIEDPSVRVGDILYRDAKRLAGVLRGER